MTIEQLRNFHNAQPFQPFVIHLADGLAIPVQHREFMASAPSGRTVSVYQSDGLLNVINLSMITDLEIKPTANGTGKRKKA